MAFLHIVFLGITLSVICSPVSTVHQLECTNGTISINNSTKTLLKINCDAEPVVVNVNENSVEECYGKGEKQLKIVTRQEWNATTERIPSEFLPRSECVIVDGSSYSYNTTDYKSKMKDIQELEITETGILLVNFFIGDNGVVYEGLGWDKTHYLESGGLNCLKIAFLKSSSDDAPSSSAVEAFKAFVRAAICLGKLSPSYRLIPYYHLHNYNNIQPTSFERKEMSKWEKYDGNSDLDKSEYDFGSFPIVFREDWGAENFVDKVYNHTSKIRFVMVGDLYWRCFKPMNCRRSLRNFQQDWNRIGIDLPTNYAIGDDGFAYEVFGWNQSWKPYWIEKDTIEVRFFGRYHSYLPSDKAMKAFNRLLNVGVMWDFLSPDYKIGSLREYPPEGKYSGKALSDEVMKMERYSSEF